MTDSFMGYKEDFEQCCDEAKQDLKDISSAPDKAAREEAVLRAENSIAEAERYLRILESESRSGDAQDRRKMHQIVRSSKSLVDKLKSHLDKTKLIADSQQRLQQRPKDMSAKDQMISYQQRLDGAGNYLDDAKNLIQESEAVAGNITANLAVQREQLGKVRTNVDNAREDVAEAGDHLASLKRKNQTKILSLYFIIVVLAVHIIYRIINIFV